MHMDASGIHYSFHSLNEMGSRLFAAAVEPCARLLGAALPLFAIELAPEPTKECERLISRISGLSESGVSFVRRPIHMFASQLIICLLCKGKEQTLLNFVRKHPLSLAVPFIGSVVQSDWFVRNCLQKIDVLGVPGFVRSATRPLRGLNRRMDLFKRKVPDSRERVRKRNHVIFVNEVIIAPLCRELFYRGIVQQLVLRTVPKLLCSLCKISTDIVDKPLLRILRVALSSLLFTLGDLNSDKPRLHEIIKRMADFSSAYFGDVLGVSAAILCSFRSDYYFDNYVKSMKELSRLDKDKGPKSMDCVTVECTDVYGDPLKSRDSSTETKKDNKERFNTLLLEIGNPIYPLNLPEDELNSLRRTGHPLRK